MDRRGFLKTITAGAIGAPAACGCSSAARWGGYREPAATTLDFTVAAPPRQVAAYTRLARGPAQPLLALALAGVAPQPGRAQRRRGLAAFVQVSDLHIVDPGAPGRLAFTRQYEWLLPPGTPAPERYRFLGASRPAEAMSTHVLAAMVERINALGSGPVTGRALDCTVSTGDNADSRGTQELACYLDLLGGGTVTPDPSGAGYRGLQSGRADLPDAVQAAFWHPGAPPAGRARDLWKVRWGFPEYPGLLQAASRAYRAEGLATRWYSGFGNHDGIDQGLYAAGSGAQRFMDRFAEGGRLPVGIAGDPLAFMAEVARLGPGDSLEPLIARTLTVEVPPTPRRRPFSRRDFARMHLEHRSRSGPVGHGYTPAHVEQDQLHFSFEVAPGILGLMLDTTCMAGGDQGWLVAQQARWLEQQLRAAHSRYYADAAGLEVATGQPDRLCIVFSHHTSETMRNGGGLGFLDDAAAPGLRPGVDFIGGAALVALLHRYPNVIAWVNGHTHHNRITPHAAPAGRRHGGFWEINTAAHIDFPQQARVIEVADNRDGTLSLFTVILDHSDPRAVPAPGADASRFGVRELAAVALELSANDRLAREADDRVGRPEDRNTELLLRHPFAPGT